MSYHYNHYHHSHNDTKQIILKTTLTITTIATTYFLTKSIRNYGLSGTLRYIWEGDHLPPEIRDAVDTLEDVELKLKKQTKKLEKVEVMIELGRLNSVDVSSTSANNSTDRSDNGNQLSPSVALSKDLTMLSYTLDKIAADIDSVPSHGDADVKRRKKANSRKLVSMMEKVDGFLKECGIET